ncbi:GntR family transcriptional regulator [Actinophytocola oryzae]|uniref:DNA-binding GntR family transcriptional regulator n=1 Tax=Actinophytocola oryzae TaxID=502181 RepID=A0A4R7VV72_9PSEU|nr:GntR family transcriptional regulator [Actinophytocola oryzae]TDV53900.1 DNA-binding GntR family transcriptional regulator [Actinophytocola oryzae]
MDADRKLFDRASTVELLAAALRERIIKGVYLPGERLAEEAIVKSLKVSRNSLREAFRLLTHERLLVHELNRGVFVRKLTVDDVVDLYRVRKLVECSAVRRLDTRPPQADDMVEAVNAGDLATKNEDWRGLGTANMMFHQAVGELADSPRIDELMRNILAELRLVFHTMADPRRFHEPYLERNKEILAAIEAGDGPRAERLMLKYLEDSEQQIVAAYRSA